MELLYHILTCSNQVRRTIYGDTEDVNQLMSYLERICEDNGGHQFESVPQIYEPSGQIFAKVTTYIVGTTYVRNEVNFILGLRTTEAAYLDGQKNDKLIADLTKLYLEHNITSKTVTYTVKG